MSKTHILQILPALETGGVERGVVDLCIYAKKRGYELKVASSGGALVKKLKKFGITHFNLNLKTKNPFKIIANAFRLAKLCKKHNIGILHARSRAPAWSAYLASFMCNAVYVTTFHGLYKENFPLKKAYNSVMAKGKAVIAVSEFCKKHIISRYPNIEKKKIIVVHRGVDVNEFNPDRITSELASSFRKKIGVKDDMKMLFIPGRITRWKGHETLLKAMCYLKEENVILVISGSSKGHENYLQSLKDFIFEQGLRQKIIITGNISDVAVGYSAADIVINSSIEAETFGRTIAEAGAMGKPVVASNIGGATEIILHNKTGKLFQNKDHLDLAEKIKEMLNEIKDENRKKEISEAAVKRINENFTVEKMGEKTIHVYNRV